ncbi:hypothetical protein Ab1vBOLIVR5_gp230c [Agrobacterium phage OLIVR5]|uniref:Uncharacterized protein n=1 Tax=Agrobacterium phage OLIVR5 TaxID=2723773 RepID=A0A858MTD8_9CAUD|nr:hypothetical protein KNU99_gp171 [Agrobacterium phage OLIVR5]QIW87878.1 hypothetical protein Ab1vBOLIVR5_gp230c [Agrobacterium phage OLIVR5]QIW88143.1 hypothetical protein Ab1vBOLIVR6_gp236c [Agrobacterium phage OLIVR6]
MPCITFRRSYNVRRLLPVDQQESQNWRFSC